MLYWINRLLQRHNLKLNNPGTAQVVAPLNAEEALCKSNVLSNDERSAEIKLSYMATNIKAATLLQRFKIFQKSHSAEKFK